MNKEARKQRFSLTLLYSIIVFVILTVSICLAALIIYILVLTGVMSGNEDSTADISTVVILMSLISLVIGILLAVFTSKIPLTPVNTIINQMNRLASGDFKARLEFGKVMASYPAFEDVSKSFNKMAEELDNTEMLRSDFINNFSHEFKTPIVSIAGFAKILKKGCLSAEQQAEYISIIEEESLRLADMATNVMNLTKVENQNILTDISTFNLSEQIRSAVLLLERKWTDKGVDMIPEFREYSVTANEELLKQAWINLIDNAVKFTPDGGTVEIGITEDERYIYVRVMNTGSEIPEEELEKIFCKFYQADKSHASKGNGVGLAIVKKVAELHRGNVTAVSSDGTVSFIFSIPKNHE